MSRTTRRTLLQGMAVGLPAAWTQPVVDSVILPAHAQTTTTGCSVEAGCYVTPVVFGFQSFQWPGGTGPSSVDTFATDTCEGSSEPLTIVVASSSEEAAESISCGDGQTLARLSTTPTVPPETGCGFYACIDLE